MSADDLQVCEFPGCARESYASQEGVAASPDYCFFHLYTLDIDA
jgi:hypothetical protein